ncbi:DUF3176 domain-containing protein [Aspergillus puulaauensis]|uniref:Uncharacterized protein n=1 Tax=Aspergillus puulaauensis TaxID=1220207 RepID=A0A7R7XD40_9EURO|nr:uncharacterized protein APUU_11671S [Aspergillus puulaauensis]BCS18843.1 hypothetical protein APUU_11671S [Aspergillus puulaauensis]
METAHPTEAEENSSDEADGQQSSPKPAKSPASKLNDNWTWEIISCFICLVCLASIVAVLLEYDGEPLPEWPYGITINSILSWITQVFTACMIGVVATCLSQSKWIYFTDSARPLADMNSYDWASRGPAGCTVFLWISRMRQFATLGALITILSIGTGPFVQQMATVKNSRVPSDSPASIARTESFFETDIWNTEPIKSEMKYVIYNAIFSSSDTTTSTNAESTSFSSYSKPDCPTGDCIIPRFQSLAACSYCSNVTHLLSVKEGQSRCDGRQTPQRVYYLPNGLNVSVSSNGTALPLDSDWYVSTSTKSDRDSYGLEAMALPGTKNFGDSAFMNLSAISVEADLVEERIVKATAMQCSLYWCVNTYNATVKNGSTSEPVLESYYDNTASFSYRYANHEDSTIVLNPPVSGSMAPANFTIEKKSSNGLSRWLADKFQFRKGNSLCAETDVGFTGHGTDFIPFFEKQPLPDLFGRLAAGITTYIRSANEIVFVPDNPEFGMYTLSHGGTEPAHGTAWAVQTLLYIHWGWITLPAVLLVLTMAFLVITALQSRNRSLDVWKSSTLPLLCSGLGLDFQRELRVAGGPTQAEDEAQQLHVRCVMGVEGPDRWRLDVMERKTN